jgi:hypothetical protein
MMKLCSEMLSYIFFHIREDSKYGVARKLLEAHKRVLPDWAKETACKYFITCYEVPCN